MVGSFIEDDLTQLFASSDFGEADGSVLWNGVVVEGAIFDDEDVEVQMGEGVTQIEHQPVLTAPSAQFAGSLADGDSVKVGAETFTLKNWKDDGTGVVELFLERT